ncbi:MAG: transcription termination/antitermination protein NusG [Thermoguttaceae bacterium]
MSDEPNNPNPGPPNISQDIAYAAGPDPAELAAEAEGMPVSPEPAAPAEPPMNPPPPPAEVSPAPAVAETAQSETPSEPVETPVPSAEVPSAETREAAPAVAETAAPPTPAPKPQEPKSDKMEWYILKVQSNREESIREGLLRRVAIAGLDRFFGDVIVPTEKVTEFKGGKKRVIKRKLYPGYLVVHMEINDDTWFLVRETPGIGDFTGAAGRPSVMLPHEVQRIVAKAEEKSEKAPKLKIGFSEGERVKIKEGTFENFEGEVESIDQTNGQVTVMINIFGRSTPVTLEYWQIETL